MADQDTTPGRKLDALIAVQVMGWTAVHEEGIGDYDGEEFVVEYVELRGIPPAGVHVLYHFTGESCIPRYSTSIEAAWMVVEKMFKDGFGFNMFRDQNDAAPEWECEFWNRAVSATAPTAPLAICLAALKAVSGALASQEGRHE